MKRDPWKNLFWSLAALLLVTMALLSQRYGTTWDEWMDANNGMLALRNILTLGRDMAFMGFWHGYLYSQFFYTVVGVLFGLFFDSVWNIAHEGLHNEKLILPFFRFSHLINALFGFWAMLYTGLFAKKLAGWRAAFLALLFIALSPRFFGNSMNNPKDIPFAATSIFALYYLAVLLGELPRVKKRTLAMTAVSLGLCIGSRLGGVVLIAYGTLFTAGILFHMSRVTSLPPRTLVRTLAAALAVLVCGIGIGFIFWPYGRTHLPAEMLRAILEMPRFEFWNNPVLFEGRVTLASDLPWYYLLKWILISTPFFFPAGLVLWAIALFKKETSASGSVLLLAAAGFFPLFFVLVGRTVVYDSWRHLLFIYPPLVVLAALGWESLLKMSPQRKKIALAWTVVALLCAEPFLWIARNSRYAGVYFNPAVGGLHGAFTRYESDYWGSCLEESAAWLAEHHRKNAAAFPFAWVWTEGQIMQTYPTLRRELGNYYRPFGYPENFLATAPYTFYAFGSDLPRNLPWNYAILISRNRTKEELETRWPPPGTIHTVRADNVPLCAVVQNEEFYKTLANARTQQ